MKPNWTIAKAPAKGSRKSFAVNSYIATSRVANSGPPKTSTTAKLVKEKAKASSDPEIMAGNSIGRVT